MWNSLPAPIRQITRYRQFRQHLKTHLFKAWKSQRIVLSIIVRYTNTLTCLQISRIPTHQVPMTYAAWLTVMNNGQAEIALCETIRYDAIDSAAVASSAADTLPSLSCHVVYRRQASRRHPSVRCSRSNFVLDDCKSSYAKMRSGQN